jgi:hypothetical protein
MLERVTITGADDGTQIEDMMALSTEFPFVEWGILVSRSQEGSSRFPSREWIKDLTATSRAVSMNISTHVCGRWVREMFTGSLNWDDVPEIVSVSQRVQINTHAEPHVSTMGLVASLLLQPGKQFVFQWDGINNHLTYAAQAYGLDVAALFDTSGGAGILPTAWPEPAKEFPCGYAGGLGPLNVVEQVRKISDLCSKPFWIDMERRVRTDDDSRLEMASVRKVLKSCAKHVPQLAMAR